MIIQVIKELNIVVVIFSIIFCFNSCKGQSGNIEDCRLGYKNAKAMLNSFYKNPEPSLLQESLRNAEKAMECEETRRSAVELKISLLTLLKEFKRGYKFIDSLSENDFKKAYKKKMNYDFFLALDYESKGDIVDRDRYFNDAAAVIENYLHKTSSNDKLNEEVYYDWFFIKSKILNAQRLGNEIDSLKVQYPDHKDFFDALKESFSDEEKVIKPS